jgi:imidazolonepropionase-like amidohydrolase
VILPDGRQRDVFVVDGLITFEEQPSAQTLLIDGFLLPGLVDCHAHLALASPASDEASEVEQIRASAEAHLLAGVLAIREPGSPNRLSHGLGPGVGLPRIFSAGRFLTAPGRYFPGLALETLGPDLAEAAAAEAKVSGQWVKVVGDFWDDAGDLAANFEPSALTEAAARVHALGARIAIHAVQPDVIEAAIEAGFDSIEHGVMMAPEHITEMARRNIAWVPTLVIRHDVPDLSSDMGASGTEVERIRQGFLRQPAMVRLAIDSGVQVLAGRMPG